MFCSSGHLFTRSDNNCTQQRQNLCKCYILLVVGSLATITFWGISVDNHKLSSLTTLVIVGVRHYRTNMNAPHTGQMRLAQICLSQDSSLRVWDLQNQAGGFCSPPRISLDLASSILFPLWRLEDEERRKDHPLWSFSKSQERTVRMIAHYRISSIQRMTQGKAWRGSGTLSHWHPLLHKALVKRYLLK